MVTTPSLGPLPPPTVQLATDNGEVAKEYAQYLSKLDNMVRSGNFPALSVNGNAVLTVAGNQTLVGGFQEQTFDLGTPANGSTITPNPSDNLKQKLINNVAGFTITPTAQVGDVELLITNGATPGTITLSGFTKQFTGDALNTVVGHKFVIFIYGFDGSVSACIVKALQ